MKTITDFQNEVSIEQLGMHYECAMDLFSRFPFTVLAINREAEKRFKAQKVELPGRVSEHVPINSSYSDAQCSIGGQTMHADHDTLS